MKSRTVAVVAGVWLLATLPSSGQVQRSAATASSPPAAAILPGSASTTATYITHVTVIEPENSKEIQDRTVIISGDRISEVRDSKGMKPPAGAR